MGAVPSESPPRPALGAGRRHGSLRRILEQRLIEKLRRLRRDAFEELGQREKVVQDLQFQRPARRLHRMPMRKVALPRAALRMPVQKISAKGASLRVAVRKIARCTSACRRWFKKLESIRHRSQPGPTETRSIPLEGSAPSLPGTSSGRLLQSRSPPGADSAVPSRRQARALAD
jgi:hypothetical protein